MNTRYRSLKWNSILALVYQVILIVTGLILPRCFLYFYGSEVNGLHQHLRSRHQRGRLLGVL